VHIRVYHSFEEALPAWRILVERCAFLTPFLLPEWSMSWWRILAPTEADLAMPPTLHIAVAYDGAQPIGLAPFYYLPSRQGAPAELRLIGDLGRGEGLTEAPIVLIDRERREEAEMALLNHFRSQLRGYHPWDVAKVRWQTRGSLLRERKRLVFIGWSLEEPGRQELPLPESWEAYHHSLGKPMRKKIAYYAQRITKEGKPWEFRWCRSVAEVEKGVEALINLHRARAESARGPEHLDHIPTEYQEAFLQESLHWLAERKEATVVALEVEGRPIAIAVVLRSGRNFVLYYTGFDPAWYDHSPLTLLTAEIIRETIAQGGATLNFLFAPAPWKRRWGAETVSTVHLEYRVAPHPRALYRVARDVIRRLMAPS